ncbi:MAG: small multi-drug export protein, partial [Thermoplasmata archaeon]|nr:small multi-drug export protein [Thermoplasmata archaeon]
AYFVPPFGKESVIPLGVSLGVHPALMAFSVAMVDVLVGLFLLWNYRVLYYIPILGKWAHKMEVKARKMIEEGRGFSKLAYLGLVLFVIVPFQGSGAVSATILGKMSGMDAKKVWSAIILGAFAGTFMVAYSFNFVLTAFRSNLFLGVGVVLAVVAVALFLYLRWKRETGKSITLHDIKEVSLMAVTTGVEVDPSPEEP